MTKQRRFALGVEYDGTNYNGWQYQPHAPSIQQALSEAISGVADESLECIGSGRTDTGVHAKGQVAHFDTTAQRSDREWLLGINSSLPDDINIIWIKEVGDEFHARYSATMRAYRYSIVNRPVRSALLRRRYWWVREPLDVSRMAQAARLLLGRHDFSSFRASGCQAKSPVREMQRAEFSQNGAHIVFDCAANAFLHHMVRNLIGTLVAIGRGDRPIEWIDELLTVKDRTLAGITAPAAGLVLTHIDFPAHFGLDALQAEFDA